MENVKRINKYLHDTYGSALDGKPKFRVVWSEDLFEVRKGQFSDTIIFEDIRKAPKYMAVSDRYILEVYTLAYPGIFHRAIQHKANIVLDGDGYEPLRVFQSRDGKYLKPDLEVCKILCDSWAELVNRPEARRLTAKQADYNDKQIMEKEVAKFYEMLSANDSDLLANKFQDREAIILPGKEF